MSADGGGWQELGKSVWQAFIVPVGIAAWAVYKDLIARRDKRASDGLTVQQRREAEAERRELALDSEMRTEREAMRAQAAALDARNTAQIGRMQTEIDGKDEEIRSLHAQLSAVRKDRDRGWDLARFYFGLAHDLNHAMREARQFVVALLRRSQPPEPPPEWQQIIVPRNLEDPIPK